MTNASLNAARRARELAEATDGRVVDLLVVGLGATGCGVALDAASRGLSVVAVDAHDLAFGTSRWSSKLVHGGLRYLAKGQVGVAHESAVERGILMGTTAPHLVRPLPMLLPLTETVSRGQGLIAQAGIFAGDLLRITAGTRRSILPGPRRVSPAETLSLAGCVRSQGLRGGVLSWEGQLEDDARLVVALARTAAGKGARVLIRTRVLELHGDGAVVRDELNGTTAEVKARAVVNAAGVWASGLVPGIRLRPSRGSHIILRPETLDNPRAALYAPVPGEINRYVFALPQPDGLVYAGLTDEPADGEIPDEPVPTPGEIGFLLDVLNGVLEAPVQPGDVLAAYAGLRPLLDGTGMTSDITRKHAVLISSEGVVTVVGGKLTTYRRMAQDAVDAVVRTKGLTAGPCVTRTFRLTGAGDVKPLEGRGIPARLIRRYGVEAAAFPRDPELLQPIAGNIPVTVAELQWGVEHEGALDVSDLLDRRTRIGLVPSDRRTALPYAERALATLPHP